TAYHLQSQIFLHRRSDCQFAAAVIGLSCTVMGDPKFSASYPTSEPTTGTYARSTHRTFLWLAHGGSVGGSPRFRRGLAQLWFHGFLFAAQPGIESQPNCDFFRVFPLSRRGCNRRTDHRPLARPLRAAAGHARRRLDDGGGLPVAIPNTKLPRFSNRLHRLYFADPRRRFHARADGADQHVVYSLACPRDDDQQRRLRPRRC